MNDWEKGFWAAIDAVASSVEEWATEVEQTLTEISATLEEEIAAEWQWLSEDWAFFWDALNEALSAFEPDPTDASDFPSAADPPYSSSAPWLSNDWEMGLNPYRPATPDHQPACQGCQHYHGYVYGGNLLVCGMHPHGQEVNECPDWDGIDTPRE